MQLFRTEKGKFIIYVKYNEKLIKPDLARVSESVRDGLGPNGVNLSKEI